MIGGRATALFFLTEILLATKKARPIERALHLTGDNLCSQAVSSSVLSAQECLTSVFGKGTGGTTLLSPPDFCIRVSSEVKSTTY